MTARSLVQFGDYLWHLVRGDLGESFRFHQSAAALVLEALPRTLLLVVGAIALATAVALPVSIFSVLKREAALDRLIRRSLIVGQGIPEFWLGLVLVLIFAARLNWLPSLGFTDWKAAILPIVTLALPLSAILTRLLRIQLLDIMRLDFVITLRAKGLTESEILFHHVLLNALIPFVTFLALQIGWLVGGTLVVEAVFTWPGLGVLALSSVKTRDLQVLQAIVILVALVYVVVNLIADLIVLRIDPRIRVGRAGRVNPSRRIVDALGANSSLRLSVVLLAVLGLLCTVGSAALGDPLHQDLKSAFFAPGRGGHLLGTDALGRDVLAWVATVFEPD